MLHLALENKLGNLVPELVKKGALANLQDRTGIRPLLIAVQTGEEGAVTTLLKAGVDVGPLGGHDAIYALEAGHDSIAEHLIKAAGPALPFYPQEGSDVKKSSDVKKGSDAAPLVRSPKSRKSKGPRTIMADELVSTAEMLRQVSSAEDTSKNWLRDVLEACMEAGSVEAATACLHGALAGAGVAQAALVDLALGLAKWAFQRDEEGGRQACLEVLEAVPRSIATKGLESTAAELLEAGIPNEVVSRLANVQTQGDHHTVASPGGNVDFGQLAETVITAVASPKDVENEEYFEDDFEDNSFEESAS